MCKQKALLVCEFTLCHQEGIDATLAETDFSRLFCWRNPIDDKVMYKKIRDTKVLDKVAIFDTVHESTDFCSTKMMPAYHMGVSSCAGSDNSLSLTLSLSLFF